MSNVQGAMSNSRPMKDSGVEWIGEIPESWQLVRVKHCYSNHKDIAGENADNYERLALTLGGVIKRPKYDSVGLQPEAFNGYQILRENELVFKLIDLANVSTSRVGYSPYTGIVSPAYIIITPKNPTESRFGVYYFLSMWQREIFNHIGDDGVRSSLNASDLLNIPYISIPFAEQRRIADFLDRRCAEIDGVIEATKKTIEEYKALKQSIITEAVTKGVRGVRPMKDSGIEWIGEIPEEWEIYAAFQLFLQVKCKNEGLVERNLLSLSYGKIRRKSIDTIGGLLPESFDGYNIIERDDIVLRLTDLQNDQTSLRVGLSTERGIVTSAYLTLRNRSSNLPIYLYYYLHTFDVCKGFYGMGAGVRQGLNWDGLKLLKIVIPPIEEQKAISEFLDGRIEAIDKLISTKQQLITELETYKKSVIYEYVTGKREVK